MKTKNLALLFTFIVAMALACNKEKNAIQHNVTDYPDWVNKSAWAGEEGNEKEKVFFGVGSVSGIKNHSLAKRTADNRARNEIAKLFQTYSASLMKDYQASTTAGDFSATSEEQHVEEAIKTFTAQTLNGVEVIDHWIHPVDGTVYALARLNLSKFVDMVEKSNELNEKVKEYVRQNANKAHSALEVEEEKRS